MFFRKKKKGPVPAVKAALDSEPPDVPTTQFLTGDENVDRRKVQLLLDAIARVNESHDLESLLNYIVDTSIDLTGAERGILVLSEGQDELKVRVARGRGEEPIEGDVRFSTTVVRKVLEYEEPVRTTVNSDSEALELGTSVFDLKLRAVMCVPLSAKAPEQGEEESAPRGVLYVDSKAATREFTREDLSLFAALSHQSSVSLLRASLHESSLEKVRLERSLEIASEIQSGLMPQVPNDFEGFDVHGWYRPAERTTGDFYDFVRTRDGRLAVVVGDVTGHGIGPALITATAQASLRSYLRVLQEPAAVVTMLNQDLDERMDAGMFLTLFVTLLSSDGELAILNAGHTPPLVWRKASGEIEAVAGNDPALGMISGHAYSEGQKIQLGEGDILVAFTDGFVEARHASAPDDMFEEAGMRQVLGRMAAEGASAREVTEALVKAALDHAGGEREDDMTVVAVRRLGA